MSTTNTNFNNKLNRYRDMLSLITTNKMVRKYSDNNTFTIPKTWGAFENTHIMDEKTTNGVIDHLINVVHDVKKHPKYSNKAFREKIDIPELYKKYLKKLLQSTTQQRNSHITALRSIIYPGNKESIVTNTSSPTAYPGDINEPDIMNKHLKDLDSLLFKDVLERMYDGFIFSITTTMTGFFQKLQIGGNMSLKFEIIEHINPNPKQNNSAAYQKYVNSLVKMSMKERDDSIYKLYNIIVNIILKHKLKHKKS